MGNPYDSIPAGKKPAYNTKKKEWELVPLVADDYNDLKVLYDEAVARGDKLNTELKRVKTELSNLKKRK